ncbi:hypothetical protein [Caulobacter sp. BK020]|uniref:hypothetical protein n=1 Tax=Caulobacter sp. BK020 TaxID=2512117 RepID=UPI00104FE1E6|nr:hypothetical protein [Caulobacter sp. BK020]TCS14575.1 hypothetical protein EV278_107224 [Caulobacter sp. BK020]
MTNNSTSPREELARIIDPKAFSNAEKQLQWEEFCRKNSSGRYPWWSHSMAFNLEDILAAYVKADEWLSRHPVKAASPEGETDRDWPKEAGRLWQGDFAEALTMTGCSDLADLIDMANVGKGLMERIDLLTRQQGQFEGWTPADDPCEIVFDLVNALEDAQVAWRTIDSAPQDGTVIDLWRDGERLVGYWWSQTHKTWITQAGLLAVVTICLTSEPSHWMLPPPAPSPETPAPTSP